MVDLGDHYGARGADRGAFLPEHPGQAVDAVRCGDGEQRGIGGPQAGPQVAGEVGVTRRVEQVDLDAAMQDRRQGEVDRPLLPDLDLVEVAHRGAVLDPAGPLDRAGMHQQRLNERRLPCPRVADQHDIAHAVGLAGRGRSARGSRAACLIGHRRRLLLHPPVTSAVRSARPPARRPSPCLHNEPSPAPARLACTGACTTSLYLPATGSQAPGHNRPAYPPVKIRPARSPAKPRPARQ